MEEIKKVKIFYGICIDSLEEEYREDYNYKKFSCRNNFKWFIYKNRKCL